jgi:hypothetical protein
MAEQEAANVVGKEVELSLKDPFGTEQQLSALNGRIVVLNFCRKSLPKLQSLKIDIRLA